VDQGRGPDAVNHDGSYFWIAAFLFFAVPGFRFRQKFMEPAREKFKRRLASDNPELFEFIDQHIVLDDMVRMETAIERSCEMFDLSSDWVPVRVFMNQWKINDIRRLNEYFLKMYQVLLPGGYYIGYAHTIDTHYKLIHKKFPRYMSQLIYLVDFCFNRIRIVGVRLALLSLFGGLFFH
jgi:hypothetical protein